MSDKLIGTVFNIIDENSFEINVEHQNSDKIYNSKEIIIISQMTDYLLHGKRLKEELEIYLKNKKVLCFIQSKDESGRLIADVQVLV